MFRSVKEYDNIVFMVLDNIKNEKKDWYKIDNLSQEDIADIIEFITDNSLAKGMYSPKEVNGFRDINSKKPRITRLGLAFIEQWQNYRDCQTLQPDFYQAILERER